MCFFLYFLCYLTICLCGCTNRQTSEFIEKLEENEIRENPEQENRKESAGGDVIDRNMKSAEENGKRACDNIIKAGEERYYNAMEKMKPASVRSSGAGFSGLVKGMYIAVYKFFSIIRIMAIPIILISELIGFTGMWMSQKNKRSKRFFLSTLCIGIPVLVLFIVFGYGSLAEIFY